MSIKRNAYLDNGGNGSIASHQHRQRARMHVLADGRERGRHAASNNQTERMRRLRVAQRHAMLRVIIT